MDTVDRPVNTVLVDLGLTSELDVPSCAMLAELGRDLGGAGVELHLANVHSRVHDLLVSSGALEVIEERHLHADVPVGIVAHLRGSQIDIPPEDVDAVILRIGSLSDILVRRGGGLTAEQRLEWESSITDLKELAERLGSRTEKTRQPGESQV